ncbi:MAG: GDSL-type esterase/lipase family protein [Bacteroidia bacterium]
MKYYFIGTLLWMAFGCQKTEKNPSEAAAINPAALAVKGEGQWWQERHETILSRLDQDPKLVLIGNSIFHSLDNEDRQAVWQGHLAPYQTVNMGISGDRTENLLWRIENGTLDNIQPKLALLLIGTNNTDGNHYLNISTADELAGGIWAICEAVRAKLPQTQILIMGILPYGYKPNHRNNINLATNRLIAAFPERDPNIHYIDISEIYLDQNGKVDPALMPDYLHPNAEGHMKMFDALEDEIKGLISEP